MPPFLASCVVAYMNFLDLVGYTIVLATVSYSPFLFWCEWMIQCAPLTCWKELEKSQDQFISCCFSRLQWCRMAAQLWLLHWNAELLKSNTCLASRRHEGWFGVTKPSKCGPRIKQIYTCWGKQICTCCFWEFQCLFFFPQLVYCVTPLGLMKRAKPQPSFLLWDLWILVIF